MKYDFITVLDRTGADSIAANIDPWGVSPAPAQRIPMWIADMSFPTAPPILEAMHKRLAFPNFGYFSMPDEYFDCILRWQETRNGLTGLTRADIGYENGVLGGVSSAVQALTVPGEAVLLHAPAYIGFTHVLDNLGRKAELSPLRRDENGVWRMDYEDMDRRLKEHSIRLAILCSPHNPTGRVWERWELEKAMEVYAANDCFVLSDEIWSDLILPGYHHIPTLSVSDDACRRTAAFYAPSKTFSLAGLIGSYHIIPVAARPRDAAGRPQPLQFLQRALAARPARSLFGRGRAMARRAAPCAGGQHPLCLRFHRRSLPRCAGHAAAGNLYAVSGLCRMAAGAPYDAAGTGGARSACRCHLAGRRGVCVAGLHPDESGPAAQQAR